MCWSSNASIISFVIAVIGIIYLYKRNKPNDRWIALFGGVVALIQLAEYFMWNDPNCGWINNLASMFALLVVASEPFMNMIGGIYFSNSPNKKILRCMLLAYIIFIVYIFFTSYHGKKIMWCGVNNCSAISQENPDEGTDELNNCNLRWMFLQPTGRIGILWVLFLMLPFLTMTPRIQGYILFGIAIFSYVLSKLFSSAVTASIWCWYALGIIYVKILM